MGSFHRNRIRRLSLTVGVGLALAGSSVFAEAPKSGPASVSLGIMNVANVSVVNAPDASSASSKQANSQGMRAYVDPTTRRLRPQTLEEGKTIAAQTEAKLAEKVNRARAQAPNLSADVAVENTGLRTIYGPGNTIGIQLTEEHMVYQVAHKTSDGLVRQEVTGKAAAQQALQSSNKKLTSVEANHAH